MTALTLGCLAWITFGKLVTVPIFELEHRLSRRGIVFDGAIPADQRRREWLCYPFVALDGLLLAAAAHTGILRLGDEGVVRFGVTLLAFFLWVELWFYASHIAMHRVPALWRIHEHHHLSRLSSPVSSASFSAGERLLVYTLPWVGFVTILSRAWPVSIAAIALYYGYYSFASPIAHGNRERIPPWVHRLPGLRWVGTTTTHALHHACADANFGFFTGVLDRWFQTAHPDNEHLYQKSVAGLGPAPLPESP